MWVVYKYADILISFKLSYNTGIIHWSNGRYMWTMRAFHKIYINYILIFIIGQIINS